MDLNSPPPSSSGFSNFPILAIALLAIMVTGFLLVSYYIFVIKCCLNWQHLHPLRRDRGPRVAESWLAFSSPATELHRGLDELVLRDIPTFKYRAKGSTSFGSTTSSSSSKGDRSFRGCAVCLSAFEDQEMLRVLPHCGHLFHLDCIDVWLLNNANCPLCRSSISGAAKRGPLDHIVAPSSSPQEIIPATTGPDPQGSDGFMVVEMASNSGETNNNNNNRKDELFDVGHPIRRSFSMDSAIDGRLLLQVQQIIWHNRRLSNEAAASSSASNRSIRRSFFSFGQGQGSKSAVLPIQSDL